MQTPKNEVWNSTFDEISFNISGKLHDVHNYISLRVFKQKKFKSYHRIEKLSRNECEFYCSLFNFKTS